MSKELYFVDTNILVYARDASEPEKCATARKLLEQLWREKTGRISVQVFNEYYVTVTRKLSPGLSRKKARADLENLNSWMPLPLSYELVELAWKIEEQFSLSWWDSLIIAAAQEAKASYLLSEDLQSGLEIGNLQVNNPFIT
jgi:predicted nucleic acid-binding protein